MASASEIQAAAEFVQALNDLRPYALAALILGFLTIVGLIVFYRVSTDRRSREVEQKKDERSLRYTQALEQLSTSLSEQGRQLGELASRVKSLEDSYATTSEQTTNSIDGSLQQVTDAFSSSSNQLSAVVSECTTVMRRVVDHLDKRMSLRDTVLLFRRSFESVREQVQKEVEQVVRGGNLRIDRRDFVSASLRTRLASIVAAETDYLNKYETYCSPGRLYRAYDKPLNGDLRTASRYHLCDIVWSIVSPYFTPEGDSVCHHIPEILLQVGNAFQDEFDANIRDIYEDDQQVERPAPETPRRSCRMPSDVLPIQREG